MVTVKIKHGDTWFSVAERVYGDIRYADMVANWATMMRRELLVGYMELPDKAYMDAILSAPRDEGGD